MIGGIHHIGIHCHDIDRMIRFYEEALGFELTGRFSWADDARFDAIVDLSGTAAQAAMMRAGNCFLELFQYSAPPPQSTQALTAADKGYTHFCMISDDIAADLQRLTAAGMDFGGRDFVEMGYSRVLYGRDPEGNIIEIMQAEPGSGMELSYAKTGMTRPD